MFYWFKSLVINKEKRKYENKSTNKELKFKPQPFKINQITPIC